MNIVEWFDVDNGKHLRAYQYLMDNGMWPENFIPENIEVNDLWQVGIMHKIVMSYIRKFGIESFNKHKDCRKCKFSIDKDTSISCRNPNTPIYHSYLNSVSQPFYCNHYVNK